MNSKQKTRPRLTLTDLLTRTDILEKASTKDTLIAHGIRLFHRHGVVGTSLDQLLKVSHKSKSQFYSHFKNKDDFVCQVVERQMSTMIRVAKRYPLNSLSEFEAWFSPYIELAELPDNLGCPVAPLASEMSPSHDSIQETASLWFTRWQECLTQFLTELGEGENFRPEFQPHLTARLLCCSIQGAFLFARVQQDTSFFTQVREQYRQHLESFKSP